MTRATPSTALRPLALRALALGAALATAAAPAAGAQIIDLSPTAAARRTDWRASVTPGILVAQPTGEFGDYVNAGVGFGVGAHYAFDRAKVLSLRADVGFLVYGSERYEAPLSPTLPRIRVDVNTTNSILMYSAGPQLMAPSGPVRPYVHGFVGGSYFSTSSSISGTDDWDDDGDFSTQHFGDGVLSWGGAGGLLIPLSVRRNPVSIDLGARYVRNGRTRYLREGSITDNPDGTLSFTPIESQTDMVVYRLGVSVGVR